MENEELQLLEHAFIYDPRGRMLYFGQRLKVGEQEGFKPLFGAALADWMGFMEIVATIVVNPDPESAIQLLRYMTDSTKPKENLQQIVRAWHEIEKPLFQAEWTLSTGGSLDDVKNMLKQYEMLFVGMEGDAIPADIEGLTDTVKDQIAEVIEGLENNKEE